MPNIAPISSHSINRYQLRTPFQILLVTLIVLSVFYPTIFAEVCILDDQEMFNNLLNIETVDLKNLFIPNAETGGYYRPFVMLTFLFDRFIWFLSPEIMHFENVALHLLNTLMVFGVARNLIGQTISSPVPLIAALLFALHPATTESVNWISGRTDVLALCFVLAAAYLVTRFPYHRGVLTIALVLVTMGGLAKETAFAFLPGLYFLRVGLLTERSSRPDQKIDATTIVILALGCTGATLATVIYFNYMAAVVITIGSIIIIAVRQRQFTGNSPYGVRSLLYLGFLVVTGLGVFWGLRRLAFSGDIPKISTAGSLLTSDINITLHYCATAAGFYAKKIFLPLPLNFAITSIDPLYGLAGILFLVFAIYLIMYPSVTSGLILSAYGAVVPALPLALGRVAWTPYAERYVYLAIPLVALAVSRGIAPLLRNNCMHILTVILFIAMGTVTFQRNLVWQKNLTLFEDMVTKTPDFKPARGLYMVALFAQKHYAEGERQYYIAQSLPSVMYEEQFDLTMASMLSEQGKSTEAEAIYRSAITKTRGENSKVLDGTIGFYLAEYARASSTTEKEIKRDLALTYLDKLYLIDKTPAHLYRTAQKYLILDEPGRARTTLRKAATFVTEHDPEYQSISTLLNRISSQ